MTTTLYTVPPIVTFNAKGYTITQDGVVVADADLWAVRQAALSQGVILNNSPGGAPQLIQVSSYYSGATGAPTGDNFPAGTEVRDATGALWEKKPDGTWVAAAGTGGSAATTLDALSDVNTTTSINIATPTVLSLDTDNVWKPQVLNLKKLSDLSDVNLTGNATGAHLMFASDSVWRPTTALPTVPGNLRAAVVGDTTVTLAWNAANGTGSTITNYTVRNVTTSTSTTVSGSTTSLVVTGLTNGTAYTFTVAAINAVGTGTTSTSLTVTPVSGTVAGTVLFQGGFETGDKSQWPLEPVSGSGITVYSASSQPTWPAPVNGTYAARFNATDGVPANSTGTRVQLNGPVMIHENDEVFINLSVYIPSAGLPSTIGLGNAFFAFAEEMGDSNHGSPESGAWDIRQDSGNPQRRICLAHGSDNNYDESWGHNIILDQWFTLTKHIKYSKNSSVGFVEVWLNGTQQTLNNGQTRRYLATMTSTDSGIYPIIQQYREYGAISGSYAIYHDGYRIATTYAAATA